MFNGVDYMWEQQFTFLIWWSKCQNLIYIFLEANINVVYLTSKFNIIHMLYIWNRFYKVTKYKWWNVLSQDLFVKSDQTSEIFLNPFWDRPRTLSRIRSFAGQCFEQKHCKATLWAEAEALQGNTLSKGKSIAGHRFE